jgi:photosystem II stability/assembly factor-like uncharacterized protein
MYRLFFLNDTLGWAIATVIGGDYRLPAILHTGDAGITWEEEAPGDNSNLSSPTDFFFTDPQTGWIADGRAVFQTQDGGSTWDTSWVDTSCIIASIDFSTAENVWATGYHLIEGVFPPFKPLVLSTTDGGGTWDEHDSLCVYQELGVLHFCDSLHGWIAGSVFSGGSEGVVLGTTDGGSNWRLNYCGYVGRFGQLDFVDPENGWALDKDHAAILHSADSGLHWEAQYTTDPSLLHDIHAINARRALAIGQSGIVANDAYLTILLTTDSGQTWRNQTSITANDFHDICFADAEKGWVVGDSGMILHITNGGANGFASFEQQQSGTRQQLTGVDFFDDKLGLAVGTGISFDSYGNGTRTGIILRTVDGGQSWDSIPQVMNFCMKSVHFSDAQNAWALRGCHWSEQGAILHSADTGLIWIELESPAGTDEYVCDIRFVGATTGWAVGGYMFYDWDPTDPEDRGRIWATTDGGLSWSMRADAPHTVNAVHFLNTEQGWAVGGQLGMGNEGFILHTTDGGATWSQQLAGYSREITCVDFIDSLHGWAGCRLGWILSTSDGGTTWSEDSLMTDGSVESICFSGPQDGWAVSGARILHYSGSGEPQAIRNPERQNPRSASERTALMAEGPGMRAIAYDLRGRRVTAQPFVAGTKRMLPRSLAHGIVIIQLQTQSKPIRRCYLRQGVLQKVAP